MVRERDVWDDCPAVYGPLIREGSPVKRLRMGMKRVRWAAVFGRRVVSWGQGQA